MKSSEPRGRDEAKELILKIIAAAPPGGFDGKIKLFKAFYLAQLFYLQETGRLLTSWPIVRMPLGPGIDEGDELLGELAREKRLVVERITVGPYPSYRYRLGRNADAEKLKHGNVHQVEAVQRAATYALSRTAEQLTAEVHENSRAWMSAPDGDPLDLALDIMTDQEEKDMEDLLDQSQEDLNSAWRD